MTSTFKLLYFGTPNSNQRWFFLVILQAAFKNRVKISSTYLAITFPRQASSHFGISPSHGSLTTLETVQILRPKHTLSCGRLRQLSSSPRMITASGKVSDGRLVARGVKAKCLLWRAEDGEKQGPQRGGQRMDPRMDGRTPAEKYDPPKLRKVSN